MKGKMMISKEEVKAMVGDWISENVFVGKGFRLIEIKTGGYSDYNPTLEVDFTNEEDLAEGDLK